MENEILGITILYFLLNLFTMLILAKQLKHFSPTKREKIWFYVNCTFFGFILAITYTLLWFLNDWRQNK